MSPTESLPIKAKAIDPTPAKIWLQGSFGQGNGRVDLNGLLLTIDEAHELVDRLQVALQEAEGMKR